MPINTPHYSDTCNCRNCRSVRASSTKQAKDLRPGDMIIRNGKRYVIEATDKLDIDGKRYEIVAAGGVLWFARWNTEYEIVEAT